ncbi:MAG: MurR/RpiR family transcriptional regulator, partial [Streptococcaceae bacterium]|nr:MurR/RpiR family transcriptional regulator [Streptococcaceae bacterium]
IRTAKNEAFFFISLSGDKEPFLSLAKEARESGQSVLSLTALSENPLSKLSNHSLFCYSPERQLNGSNIQDKVPLLVISESLFEAYKKVIVIESKV